MNAKHFEVIGSRKEEGKSYRTNVTCHVVAESALRALALVLKKYPGLEVYSVNHKGKIDYIEEVWRD